MILESGIYVGLFFLVCVIVFKKVIRISFAFFKQVPKHKIQEVRKEDDESILQSKIEECKHIKNSKYDTVIIGSGMSGLATAGYLSKGFNQKVLVLEAHPESIGGNTHTFETHGFEYSSGLHFLYGESDVDMSQLVLFLLSYLSNGRLKYKNEKNPKLIIHNRSNKNEQFSIPFDFEKQKKELIKLFPEEKKGINKFYRYSKKMNFELCKWIFLKSLPTRIAKFLMFFGFGRRIIKSIQTETLKDVLNKFIKDKKLKNLLSNHLTYNGANAGEIPFAFYTTYFCELTKRSFPTEGSKMIAKTIIKVIKENKGICVCNARVKRIITKRIKGKETAIGVKVKIGEDSTIIFAKTIVSSIGYELTYLNLLPKKETQLRYPKSLKSLLENISEKDTCSAFTIFLGFDNSDGKLDLPSNKEIIFRDINLSTDELSKYISSQKKFKPKNCDRLTIAVLPCLHNADPKKVGATMFFFTNRKWYDEFELKKGKGKPNFRGNEYLELKDELLKYGLNVLFSKYPKLEEKLIHVTTATPLTNNFYCNTPRGSFYGTKMNGKYGFELKRNVSHIKGLFLTGQDTFIPGVGAQLLSSLFTVSEIVDKNLLLSAILSSVLTGIKKIRKDGSFR